jgi:hypothetical protein
MKPLALLAEFDNADLVASAISKLRETGFTQIEAFSPFPQNDVIISLALPPSPLPLITLVGGVLGAICGFALQAYTAIVQYPIDIGGRPLFSWPAFVPITFECGVLGAACATFFGFLICNGLPRFHHELFDIEAFSHASNDRFFISVAYDDPVFEDGKAQRLLIAAGAQEVHNVST